MSFDFVINNESDEEIAIALEASVVEKDTTCVNNAPLLCFQKNSGAWCLIQGCCNSWQCPRCSTIRARHEYGNIVHGAKALYEQYPLWFVTLTMRGKDLDLSTADDQYYQMTNRLLAAWRAHTKTIGQHWAYVQVTERQKRGAAHSHLICTMTPRDTEPYATGEYLPNGALAKRSGYFSRWLMNSAVKAGLGRMIDISRVDSPHGAGSYVAKYLFKDIQCQQWPKHWKRIRYSRNWPKVDAVSTAQAAFAIIRANDWNKARQLPVIRALDPVSYERSMAALCLNVLPPQGY